MDMSELCDLRMISQLKAERIKFYKFVIEEFTLFTHLENK